jgi:hypothetical protein
VKSVDAFPPVCLELDLLALFRLTSRECVVKGRCAGQRSAAKFRYGLPGSSQEEGKERLPPRSRDEPEVDRDYERCVKVMRRRPLPTS